MFFKNRRTQIGAALLLAASAFAAGCQGGGRPQRPFSYTVNSSVQPYQATIGEAASGLRPLSALQDDSHLTTSFVTNEIVLRSSDRAQAESLASRYHGQVVGSDAVPAPEASSGIQWDSRNAAPTTFLIRLSDMSALDGFNSANFESEMNDLITRHQDSVSGIGGPITVSDNRGVKLLSIIAHEISSSSIPVSPNFVSTTHGIVLSAQEHPTGATTFENPFNWSEYQNTGRKSSVLRAWQFIEALRSFRSLPRVSVAVIDGGFWLTTSGEAPTDSTTGIADFPSHPTQYDFIGDDYIADGSNAASCTGGSGCPWHGNGSVSTAVARFNNRAGAAGTGGSVADPMMFKTSLDDFQVKRAVRTATAWHADVVSMSFGGECNWFCRVGRDIINYSGPFDEAKAAGLVLLAAAGNDSYDTNDKHVYPCTIGSVICVGATTLRDDGRVGRIDYSNWGSSVAIWAPTDIHVVANPTTAPGLANHNGTSASTPFVAGVVAMMKAVDRSLNSDQVRAMLRDNALSWTDSPESAVDHYINAYRVVRRAAGDSLPADTLEPNDSPAAARLINVGTTSNLSNGSNWDYYRFTLTDYAVVDFVVANLVFATDATAIMNSALVVTPEGGVGAPYGITDTSVTGGLGRTYHAGLMAPGSYRVLLTTPAPAFYNMALAVNYVGLTPDRYEVNDTLATATNLSTGDYDANLHVSSDLDHYRFNVVLSLLQQHFEFKIESSDMPVTLTLYDSTGTAVQTSTTIGTTQPKLTMGNGTWTVRVSGHQRGRYIFSAYGVVNPNLFPMFVPNQPIHWFNPGDPGPHWLVGDRDIYGFAVNENTRAIRNLNVVAAGLTAKLVDVNGREVSQSTTMTVDAPRTVGGVSQITYQQLPISGLTLNQTYFIVIDRAVIPDNAGVPTEVPGAIAYQMSVQ